VAVLFRRSASRQNRAKRIVVLMVRRVDDKVVAGARVLFQFPPGQTIIGSGSGLDKGSIKYRATPVLHFEGVPGLGAAANLLTRADARCIIANIAKLSDLPDLAKIDLRQ
jgi:hypothetical protein